MKRLLACMAVGVVLAMVVPTAMGAAGEAPAASQPASGATFELTYRGLTVPDDPLSYRSYWGFGTSNQPDNSFIVAVKKRVKQFHLVCNMQLPEPMRWSLVELQDGKPIAFYFDADGDGKFSDNERFPPVSPQRSGFGYACAFITSDFMVRTPDGKEAPFRVMLVASKNEGNPINYMWTQCCVLEGQATLNGEATKLVLYDNNFDGVFSKLGQASFALFPTNQKIDYPSRDNLSSLICYKETFYRVKVAGSHEKDSTVRVTLEKDTSLTGRIGVELTGAQGMKGRLTSAAIAGTADQTVYFHIPDRCTTLPIGAYKLSSGYLSYGIQSDDEWHVNFDDDAAFSVTADATSTLKLGELALSISAVAENDRYNSNAQPKTTFLKGTAIYISPQIKGKAGEAYMRFTRQTPAGGVLSRLASIVGRVSPPMQYTDVKPHLTIKDADGKTVASADLEYG